MEVETTSLSELEGEPWEKWMALLGRDEPADDEDLTSDLLHREPVAECKRLPLADMALFGCCPEVDPFVTVVCEHCDLLVKPQFFSAHVALRHPETVKVRVARVKEPPAPPVIPVIPAAVPAVPVIPPAAPVSRGAELVRLTSSTSIKARRLIPTVHKLPDPSLLDVKKELSLRVSVGSLRSGERLLLSQPISEPVVCPGVEAPSPPAPPQAPEVPPPPPAPLPAEPKKKKKSAPAKVYCPDVHCGVWNEQTKKNCMRALSCRTHSLLLKRAVPMRSKLFDVLLAEHRAAIKARKDQDQLAQSPSCAPLVEAPLPEAPLRAEPSSVPALRGSMTREPYSWRMPDLAVPIALETYRDVSRTSLLEPALPGPQLAAEPGFAHAEISDSIFTSAHPKPLTMCSLGLHTDGGYLASHRRLTMLRRTVRAAVEDTGYGGPIRTDMYGFPCPPHGAHHSTIKTVLSNICGRAAQRSASHRNSKLGAAKVAAKGAVGKNATKYANLVIKTVPVNPPTLLKESAKFPVGSLHAITLVGAMKSQANKLGFKRLAVADFKENDLNKCARTSKGMTDVFGKAGGGQYVVAYSGKEGTSLLRSAEHGPGESLLVSRGPARAGAEQPASAQDGADTLRAPPKGKGSSLIRLSHDKATVSGKMSGGQAVTCIAASGSTMMALQHVLGPQVMSQMGGKAGAGNMKVIPHMMPPTYAIASGSSGKTFILKNEPHSGEA